MFAVIKPAHVLLEEGCVQNLTKFESHILTHDTEHVSLDVGADVQKHRDADHPDDDDDHLCFDKLFARLVWLNLVGIHPWNGRVRNRQVAHDLGKLH